MTDPGSASARQPRGDAAPNAERRPACDAPLPACLRMCLWRVPGLFVVNKPSGPSSFDVVRAARRELGVRKIGHAGTLDPLAEGVLVLGVGRATRLLSALSAMDKSYRAGVSFGVRTDTFDATGRVLEERDASGLSGERLRSCLARFRGRLGQVPPMHSALKRDGRPLYELAREGVEVEREPRTVEISRLELVEFSPPEASGPVGTTSVTGRRGPVGTTSVTGRRGPVGSTAAPGRSGRPRATIEIDCSKGTYVRSLVEDIGRALGTGAVMTALVRTRVGPFGIGMARSIGRLLA